MTVKSKWNLVVEYCKYDVLATEAVWNDLTYMDYWNGFKALTDLAYTSALCDGEYEIASDMLSVVTELTRAKRICELSDELGVDRIELDEKKLN